MDEMATGNPYNSGAGTRPAPAPLRRRRGRPRVLDHDTVVRAAVRIADADGMAALTMARLAAELGVAVMTLYTYVPNKERLLDDVIEAALAEATPPEPPTDPAAWQEVVFDAFVELHDVMQAHWTLVESAGTRATLGSALAPWLEALLEVLEWVGFKPDQAAEVYRELVCFALGDTFLRIAHLPGLQEDGSGGEFGFVQLTRVAKTLAERSSRDQFVAGLQRVLRHLDDPAGVERVAPQRREPEPAQVPAQGRPATSWLQAEAVRLVLDARENYESDTAAVESVAEKLGVPVDALGSWVAQSRLANPEPPELVELTRLRTELRELKQANDILKSASSFFASQLDRQGQAG